MNASEHAVSPFVAIRFRQMWKHQQHRAAEQKSEFASIHFRPSLVASVPRALYGARLFQAHFAQMNFMFRGGSSELRGGNNGLRQFHEAGSLSDIGKGFAFRELYGYYAQGVGEQTAVLPSGWRDRLVRILNPNTNGVTGLCLKVHDLAISKYVAGREKDIEFTRELAKQRMTRGETLLERLKETELSAELRKIVAARIKRDSQNQKST